MNIVLINKSDRLGGASIACRRLLDALLLRDADAIMLVQEKRTAHHAVFSTTETQMAEFANFSRFAWERLSFLPHEQSKDVRFAFSLANTGYNITRSPHLHLADVIHLHWFNQGFLSLDGLKKIFDLGKPVVWTLHDMWAFTGGCHYSGECFNYTQHCNDCMFLRRPSDKDLSYRLFERKMKLFDNIPVNQLHFVTCSNWLGNEAARSRLIERFNITSIPNPINTEIFSPSDKVQARRQHNLPTDKKLILFGAANIFDKRKGFHLLVNALTSLHTRYPQSRDQIALVVFGKSKNHIDTMLPFETIQMPSISNEATLASLYSAADVFVLPSLEDNLPNTVMESLACGTPVAAFRIGGVPEMVEHLENGWLAPLDDTSNLAEGIHRILFAPDYDRLSHNARHVVEQKYSQTAVAEHYITLYHHAYNSMKKHTDHKGKKKQ